MFGIVGGADLLASYWGKADPAACTGTAKHHTVLAHSVDVAAVAHTLLLRHPTLTRQFGFAQATAEATALTAAAICALHDVGKLDTRFQRKAPEVANQLRPHTSALGPFSYDHGAEGFRLIEADDDSFELVTRLLGPSAAPLLRAVCGHHGELPVRDEPSPTRSLLPRSVRREDEAARVAFITTVLAFFRELGAALPVPIPADGPLVQRLAGLCAVADWIGSNTDFFPYLEGPVALTSYWTTARERAASGCESAGLLRAASPRSAGFAELFPGLAPRDVQLLTEAVDTSAPALVIVEAEMGKGKTEAALSTAARFLRDGAADGITVTLPTMATSNAMFARVEAFAASAFPDGDVQLALAHSRASRQPRFQALVQRVLTPRDEDAPEASVSCARWLLHRKRVLLAQLGVGTIDQALQAALLVRHQFVRMFGLSRNVVVIDEVHAYDAYMEVLLEHLLGWLGALRVPVILLSATLPAERRAALIRAWRGEAEPVSPEGPELTRSRPYPVVAVATRESLVEHVPAAEPASREVKVEFVRDAGDEPHVESVAARLLAAARAGARVAWIRNTVREAQAAFQAVVARAEGLERILFHARFRGVDRARIEECVLGRFGKQAPPGGRVLVATQVVEQSLDLDFDEMHTDLAPIDLVLQRIGRLHRHPRRRPHGFAEPRLVVHAPSESARNALRFGPSRWVYDAGTLFVSHEILASRPSLRIPADIRALVEETYHPVLRRANLARGGQVLLDAEERLELELEARRTNARRCCIPPTTADPDGSVALPDDDDAVAAFTRDGSSVTVLPFAWDGHDGRPLYDQLAQPWQLDAGRSGAWRLSSEILDQTLSLPARAEVRGLVEPSDEERWADWRARFVRFTTATGLGERVAPVPLRANGPGYTGWLRLGSRRRRVSYDRDLGLGIEAEEQDEEAR